MRVKVKAGIILLFLCIPLFLSVSNAEEFNEDNEYHIAIISNQWDFELLNLIQIAEDTNQTITAISSDIGSYREIANYGNEMTLLGGMEVIVYIYSMDSQHGVAINEVDFNLPTNRPLPGEQFSDPIIGQFTLPSEEIVLEGFCHVFCGLGHPDQKFTLNVVGQSIFTNSEGETITVDAPFYTPSSNRTPQNPQSTKNFLLIMETTILLSFVVLTNIYRKSKKSTY